MKKKKRTDENNDKCNQDSVLEKQFSKISDMEKLMSCKGKWENTPSYYKRRDLVVDRMIQVLKEQLPTIFSMEELISLRKNTDMDSKPRILIEDRMAMVLGEELPAISSMDKLIFYWSHASNGSKAAILIEGRMKIIIEAVSNWEVLQSYHEKASYQTMPQKIVESRMFWLPIEQGRKHSTQSRMFRINVVSTY